MLPCVVQEALHSIATTLTVKTSVQTNAILNVMGSLMEVTTKEAVANQSHLLAEHLPHSAHRALVMETCSPSPPWGKKPATPFEPKMYPLPCCRTTPPSVSGDMVVVAGLGGGV